MSRTLIATVERDGLEVEVEVEVEFQWPEPDVGISGGICVHGAKRVDNGEEIELTDKEQWKISEDHADAYD